MRTPENRCDVGDGSIHRSLVRYDLPSVRELVILEPQWIIDAVSMVIRNYERETAAESHASDLLMQFNSVS